MVHEITLVDNQYIDITNIYEGGTLITTSKTPTKPINEWTPAYEKKCKYWEQFADNINRKLKHKHNA